VILAMIRRCFRRGEEILNLGALLELPAGKADLLELSPIKSGCIAVS
jgi:hypothetical protein